MIVTPETPPGHLLRDKFLQHILETVGARAVTLFDF